MSYTAWSTTRLAELLAAVVGRVVVDETRLTGSFDIELTYENEELRRRFPGPGLPREAPDLFTALQEQLGLRLVPSRAPVDVLVIDAVERPTPN